MRISITITAPAGIGLFLATLVVLCCQAVLLAEVPRVLPQGQAPDDKRLGKLVDLNAYFPFEPSKSKDEWAARADRVRQRILVATGLWPMPTRTAAHAVVHGKVDRDDYTVERVFLESYPGHFVT